MTSQFENKSPLTEYEVKWRDRYDWLLTMGYKLRPRYEPDWTPSWRGTKKYWRQCEDGVPNMLSHKVMDAVRVSDNQVVMFKRISVSNHPHEIQIHQFLRSESLVADARNHTCFLLDVLQDPFDADIKIIVMPFLCFYNDPMFNTIGEAVEFFRQAIEGLEFMHEHHIAHRDVMRLNIMMDALPILPDLFHPMDKYRSRDFKKERKPYTRTARPVKYYYIDFGLSRQYAADEVDPLEQPILGADRSVPEFQLDPVVPCNPFRTDIYYLGNLIRQDFTRLYSNFSFIEPLVAEMVQDDPERRPTIGEVSAKFSKITSKLSWLQLRARPVRRKHSSFESFVIGIYHTARYTLPELLLLRPAVPTPKH